MDIVTIDFETYYDRDYSLSKITTEAYIRSPLFEVIGVGVKVNNGPVDTYSGEDAGKFLKSLDYRDKAILCHNTAFDGAILSWRFGIKPKLWFDTLSMARPKHAATVGGSLKALAVEYELGQKGEEVIQALGKRRKDFTPTELAAYMRYCANDVDLTYALFKKLRKGFPTDELLVIDQTLRMYTEPTVELDADLLDDHLARVIMGKQLLMDSLGGKGKDMIMSNEKFAKLLRKRGVDVPMKTSGTTGKETYAFAKTDLDFLALQDHHDPVVQTLIGARLGLKSTLEETRTSNLIAASKRGPLPIMLNYYGAHTGRFSGGDKLNLQNLPSRGDNTIRRALRAPYGHKIISCDSSQIEARMVAYIAGQTDLVQQFREGRDVYSEFASDIYHRKISKGDKVERFVGKTCILGLGYMTGSPKLRDTLKRGQGDISVDVTEEEAKEIVDIYRRKNHKIVSLWGACGYALSSMVAGRSGRIGELLTYNSSGILLPNGMTLQYHGLQAKGHQFLYVQDRRMFTRAMKARLGGDQSSVGEDLVPGQSRLYGGKVTENLVQALARIVVSGQMLKIKEAGYHVAFQVHDENVCVVPDAQAEQAQKDIVEIMSTPPSWAPDLPVACEAGMADTYGDA